MEYFLGTHPNGNNVGINEVFTIGLTNPEMVELLKTIEYNQTNVYDTLLNELDSAIQWSVKQNVYGDNDARPNNPRHATGRAGQDKQSNVGALQGGIEGDEQRTRGRTSAVSRGRQVSDISQETSEPRRYSILEIVNGLDVPKELRDFYDLLVYMNKFDNKFYDHT